MPRPAPKSIASHLVCKSIIVDLMLHPHTTSWLVIVSARGRRKYGFNTPGSIPWTTRHGLRASRCATELVSRIDMGFSWARWWGLRKPKQHVVCVGVERPPQAALTRSRRAIDWGDIHKRMGRDDGSCYTPQGRPDGLSHVPRPSLSIPGWFV